MIVADAKRILWTENAGQETEATGTNILTWSLLHFSVPCNYLNNAFGQ
jgi:hypothetical protein